MVIPPVSIPASSIIVIMLCIRVSSMSPTVPFGPLPTRPRASCELTENSAKPSSAASDVYKRQDFNKLKNVYANQSYEFEEYDSEEEEISKTIRCILNFVDYQPDAVSI